MAAAATATGTGTGALTVVLPPCPARASTFRRAQVRPHRLPTLRCRRARPLTTAAAAASSSSSSPVFHGECFVVGENIDTDQIIPAEHLTLVPSKPDEYRKLGSDRPQPENDCLVIILISSCWLRGSVLRLCAPRGCSERCLLATRTLQQPRLTRAGIAFAYPILLVFNGLARTNKNLRCRARPSPPPTRDHNQKA
jgi:hypothetical protein